MCLIPWDHAPHAVTLAANSGLKMHCQAARSVILCACMAWAGLSMPQASKAERTCTILACMRPQRVCCRLQHVALESSPDVACSLHEAVQVQQQPWAASACYAT